MRNKECYLCGQKKQNYVKIINIRDLKMDVVCLKSSGLKNDPVAG
jgi:hypothetical protein